MAQVIFVPDPVEYTKFTKDPNGDIGQWLRKKGYQLQDLAQRSARKHSGALAASITSDVLVDELGLYLRVGSALDYALIEHEGSRPHLIRPRSGRMLRFVNRGMVVYAHTVHHPGTKGSKYLSRHLPRIVIEST